MSTIIGTGSYEGFKVPQVIAGFEPLDVLLGIRMLARQVVDGRCEVENAYRRAVKPEGNPRAQHLMKQVFEVVDARWRGFPTIPNSGLTLRYEYRDYDALEM